MSEPFIEHREEFNINDIARKYAERVARVIDEQTLANVENQLAEFGYVKVVRCRDCKHFHPMEGTALSCRLPHPQYGHLVQWQFAEPDGYCWRGKRKEGGDDR